MAGLARQSPFAEQDARERAEALRGRRQRESAVQIPSVRTFDPDGEVRWKGIEIWVTEIRTSYANSGPGHRYMYRSGQTVEWTGTEPVSIEMDSVWWGDGWQDRLDLFLHYVRTDPFGTLIIPDGPSGMVGFIRSADRLDGGLEGAEVRIRFEEHGHEPWPTIAQRDSLAMLGTSLDPADAAVVATPLAEYTDAATYPDRYSDAEIAARRAVLDASLVALTAGLDLRSTDGCRRRSAILRTRWYALNAMPV